MLKRPSLNCQNYVDQKYLLHSGTSLKSSKPIKKGWVFQKIFGNGHFQFQKMKKTKVKKSIFDSPLIVNQTFSQTKFIINKSSFPHIMHF